MRVVFLVVALSMLAGCSLSSTELPDDNDRRTPSNVPAVGTAPEQVLLTAGSDGSVRQLGSAPVQLSTVTQSDGSLGTTEDSDGQPAFQFPSYTSGSTYPRAVIRVLNAGLNDALSPGDRDFAWGADFKLDADNEGQPIDNGNNLIARGLYDEPTQYKAEVDGNRPECSVKGNAGRVIVRMQQHVVSDQWYRLRCEKTGSYLTVRVWRLDGGKLGTQISSVKTGQMGRVTMASPVIPLSVGGKLSPDGSMLVSATDQFNGAVARPFLSIDK